MAKNKNYYKSYRNDSEDEEYYDLFSRDEGLSTSVNSKTGTKSNLSFQTSRKFNRGNVFDSETRNKYKHINASIEKYEENWDNFYKNYLFWKKERLNTISKLRDLTQKVHDDELDYNKTNIMFKELNVSSRMLKDSDNSILDCFASIGTFLSDAACGMSSIAQAINTDRYNAEFKKIMEDDADFTKSLYISRSRCLELYRDVEEVIRRFHFETFEDTMGTISKTLKLEDLWLDIKNAHGENPVSSAINCIDRFMSKNNNVTNIGKVYNSLREYVEYNPATLDACKSAGKVIYGIYETCDKDQKQKTGIKANTNYLVNKMILRDEMNELRQLHSKVDNSEMTHSILESKIEEAIDSLQSELKEVSTLFNTARKTI